MPDYFVRQLLWLLLELCASHCPRPSSASPLPIVCDPVLPNLSQACVGIIWDVAEGICILARRGRRGIHPGAIVAIDLLLWLGFIVGVVFHAIFVVYDFEGYEMYTLSRAILAFGILEM